MRGQMVELSGSGSGDDEGDGREENLVGPPKRPSAKAVGKRKMEEKEEEREFLTGFP